MKTMNPGALEFLTPNDWKLLRVKSKPRIFQANEAMIKEDSSSRALFVLRTGWARIEKMKNGSPTLLAKLGPGSLLGEMAFLETTKASASVIADTEVEAESFDFNDLLKTFEDFPHLGSRFYRSIAIMLSRRLRETSKQLAAK